MALFGVLKGSMGAGFKILVSRQIECENITIYFIYILLVVTIVPKRKQEI